MKTDHENLKTNDTGLKKSTFGSRVDGSAGGNVRSLPLTPKAWWQV